MSKKKLSEKVLVEGMTPYTAHGDELATVTLDELDFAPSESDYKIALTRIESLFDVAEPGTPKCVDEDKSDGGKTYVLAILLGSRAHCEAEDLMRKVRTNSIRP